MNSHLEPTPGASGRAFVGRERELAELQAGLRDAIEGRGRLFLIVGEAGIGKTRLATELQIGTDPGAARVSWARCWEGEGAPAFWPWTVLLRHVTRGLDDARLRAALGARADLIAHLLPELRERLPEVPCPAAAPGLDSEHARFPLFDAIARFLRQVAETMPLVLLLDDLQAADDASLRLLSFVARDLDGARLLVIGTCREGGGAPESDHSRLLGGIGRAGVRLPLAGWARDETARFVRAAAGVEPAPGLVEHLHALTDGNPFFVDEIVRLLLAEGGGRLPATLTLRLPGSIRATIHERLRPLPPACVRVLEAAAVIGREFDLATLRATLEDEGGAVVEALAAAEAAAVIVRRRGAVPRYGFAHALTREALYEAMSSDARMTWHQRVGEALERLHAADLGPHLDELAHHFAHAASSEAAAKAIAYDVRAAARAGDMLAYEAAVRHLERALQAHALLAAPDAGAALELRLQLGEMQAAAWANDSARATFHAAAEQARRLGRAQEVARAALGVAGLGFGLPRGVVDAENVALLEEALRGLPESDPLWPRVAVRLAVELHFSADAERRETLSQAAVAAARRLPDLATLAYVLNARHFAAWDSAEVEERLALADEAVRLADRIGEPETALQGRTWRLMDLWEVGDVTGFDREYETYARLAEARQAPKFLGFASALRGLRLLWAGKFEEVVSHSERVLAFGQRIGDRAAFMSAGIQVFVARRAQGRLAEIEPTARLWAEQAPTIPAARCLLAVLYADLGRAADARREYELLAADDFVALQRRNVWHPLLPYLAELALALADGRRAAILYRGLLPFAGRNMGLGPHVIFGPASHPLGTLAAHLGQWDDAERHFRHAIEEATRAQGPAWLAAIECDYGAALWARGETARADPLLRRARAAAERLGMELISRRLTALERLEVPQREALSGAVAAAAESGRGGPASGRDGSNGRVLRFPVKAGARPAARPPGPQDGQFRREGEYWTVGIGGDVVRLRDTSGLRYLAALLQQPSAEVHALLLAGAEQGVAVETGGTEEAAARQAGLAVDEAAGAHALLDEQARAAYRSQLGDLREQLAEAERFNDPARAEAVRREIDFLSRELARAVGLHGRARPGSTRAERARLNVTRAIRSAIRRIAAANRDLGLYFDTTIRTGAFCAYHPDPRVPVRWTF
ncbi:AAA family ATPase [bacterium]|nr:AAA family ATPase [bacterium]